jgi:hypothetical protein
MFLWFRCPGSPGFNRFRNPQTPKPPNGVAPLWALRIPAHLGPVSRVKPVTVRFLSVIRRLRSRPRTIVDSSRTWDVDSRPLHTHIET